MNYLSDVRICVTKKHLKILKNELYKINSNLLDICDYKKEVTGADNLKYVIFGWKNIEWYLTYADIFMIIKILKEFKAKGIPFKFLKIGMDDRDFEIDACYGKDAPTYNATLLNSMITLA